MSTTLRVYTGDGVLKGAGLPDINTQAGDDEAVYRPVSYPDLATARAALNAPGDANYVIWNHDGQHLEQVFASLGANDILVLPERPEPYPIDSSNGFMASNTSEVFQTDVNNVPIPGTTEPIVENSRLWFEMCRARRGILGLGPGAVIQPTQSGFTRMRQAESPNRMFSRKLDGSIRDRLVGCAEKLIGTSHSNAWFGNFTLRGRDFGNVCYSGIGAAGVTFKRIHVDGGWRGVGSKPNIEAGALGVGSSGIAYTIENCLFTPNTPSTGSSPIMINSSPGGTMRDIMIGEHHIGMLTIWNSRGDHYLYNVHTTGRKGINLESNTKTFRMFWTGGTITLVDVPNYTEKHVDITPHYANAGDRGSIVAQFVNVVTNTDVGMSAIYGGGTKIAINIPNDSINTVVQRKSDVTWVNDGVAQEIYYIPGSKWLV